MKCVVCGKEIESSDESSKVYMVQDGKLPDEPSQAHERCLARLRDAKENDDG